MTLLRFLLCLLAFIGALVAAGVLVLSLVLILRFPPLLIAVVLACWLLSKLLKVLRIPGQEQTKKATASMQ